ncbi:MAG: chemotaxis protein CheD [Bryobacterales bacterium]|nr:chemotaxis protein CheD [Bryobacterales bacterium]
MGLIVVGISEYRCSTDRDASIVTYALGSCIGVGAFDPVAGVAGILHFLLPDSRQDPERALGQPASYADTGIPLLIRAMERLGADRRRIRVRLAGGAQILSDNAQLAVGKRNYMAARKALWQLGVMVEMEAVGGAVSRNLGITVDTGDFWVQTKGPGGNTDNGNGSAGEKLARRGLVTGARECQK